MRLQRIEWAKFNVDSLQEYDIYDCVVVDGDTKTVLTIQVDESDDWEEPSLEEQEQYFSELIADIETRC